MLNLFRYLMHHCHCKWHSEKDLVKNKEWWNQQCHFALISSCRQLASPSLPSWQAKGSKLGSGVSSPLLLVIPMLHGRDYPKDFYLKCPLFLLLKKKIPPTSACFYSNSSQDNKLHLPVSWKEVQKKMWPGGCSPQAPDHPLESKRLEKHNESLAQPTVCIEPWNTQATSSQVNVTRTYLYMVNCLLLKKISHGKPQIDRICY